MRGLVATAGALVSKAREPKDYRGQSEWNDDESSSTRVKVLDCARTLDPLSIIPRA